MTLAPCNRLHMVYVVGQLASGGLERQIVYLCGNLRRRGYRPAVAVWNARVDNHHAASLRRQDVEVIDLHGSGRRRAPWQKIAALREVVRTRQAQVVHAYSFYLNIAAFLATCGNPAVACGAVQCDFTFDLQAGPLLGPLCAALPRTQIYNNACAARTAQTYPPWMRPRQPIVVRNGMPLEAFPWTPLPPGPPWQLVGLGRLEKQKRWDVLLEALALLRDRGIMCEVTLVGGGEQHEALRLQAERLRLGHRVRMVGDQRHVQPYLERAHLALLTSDAEGVPNALMEAMASGRPVVATAVGDVPWLVDHGHTGHVVPPRDPQAVADAIVELLAEPQQLHRMGQLGRQRAEENFSVDRLANETLAAYAQAGWSGAL